MEVVMKLHVGHNLNMTKDDSNCHGKCLQY